MSDEIIQELWSIKDSIAKEADYDVDTLCRQLNERQSERSERSKTAKPARDAHKSRHQ